MSSTNKTTNYELPLFIGTDKPTWLGDFNGAMNKIDTAVKNVSDVASGNTSTIGGVQDDVDSLETQVGTLENTVAGHTSSIASQGASITGLQTTVNQYSTQISAINSDISNIKSDISDINSDLSESNTNQLGSDITLNSDETRHVNVDLTTVRWLKIAGTNNTSSGTKTKIFCEIPISQFNVNDQYPAVAYGSVGYNANLQIIRTSNGLQLHLSQTGWTDSWTFKLFG